MIDEYCASTRCFPRTVLMVACVLAAACGEQATDPAVGATDMRYSRTGTVQESALDEISGLQASRAQANVLWVHNDDGKPRLHAIDESGAHLGHVMLNEARNTDWEDIALLPGPNGDRLVIADTGDNLARRASVTLYLIDEPQAGTDGRFSGRVDLLNRLELTWPDGPRDCEAVAWDPVGEQLLLLSKRDKPPRLYRVAAADLLTATTAQAEFISELQTLRPPAPGDRWVFGKHSAQVARPTGLDLSADGRRAAVISYRSLYLWELGDHANWHTALNTPPLEILGPPGKVEEGVSFSGDGQSVYVGSEGRRAPIYRFDFLAPTPEMPPEPP